MVSSTVAPKTSSAVPNGGHDAAQILGAASYPAAELAVGAGWLSLSPCPGKGGGVAADLRSLAGWRADLLLSLIEVEEFPAGFAEEIVASGLPWLHLPIPDYGTPSDLAVSQALPALVARLQRGERIAIHCMGGCGRSGMIALRLMIALGEPADTALSRLRKVRPCAVETEAQRDWAVSGQEAKPGASL